MRKFLFFIILSFYSTIIFADDAATLANQALLPATFTIYTDGEKVANQPTPGLTQKGLETVNFYTGAPGCYVACYSHINTPSAAYSVAEDIFVYGQVRVPGVYVDRVCIPSGYVNKDISQEQTFRNLCKSSISGCLKNECWGGGDTGGFFGIT